MFLSDRSIREQIEARRLVIRPLAPNAVQPSSVDLRLGRTLRVFLPKARGQDPLQGGHRIDLARGDQYGTHDVELQRGEPYFLLPGQFALGVTLEAITLPDDLVGRLDGKSSLGRFGLLIHATAGLVDPGWDGRLTLELGNLGPLPISLYYGMKIGQISFSPTTTPVDIPYGDQRVGSRYQGDHTATLSRYALELDPDLP